jgi:Dynein heavy chain, N-terminal region 1
MERNISIISNQTRSVQFKTQNHFSEAYHMSQMRDLPPIAGAIIWARQIERQLQTYIKRVEDVLGKGWEYYAEGVDTKLDEFQAVREEAERQRLEVEQRQRQALEQEITATGEDVGVLASEIGDLITRVGKLEVGVGASRKEREESKKKLSEVGFFPFI